MIFEPLSFDLLLMKLVMQVLVSFLPQCLFVSFLLSCVLQKFPSVAFGGLHSAADLAGRFVELEPRQITEFFEHWVD